MPSTLHPHLKRGLAFNDYHVHPDDIIEHVSPDNIDPEEQEAKRRRIEKFATQCLQGRPPVMMSASLRGPFNDGWKNPWAKPKKKKRKSSEKVQGSKFGIGRKDPVSKVEPKEAKRRRRSGSRRTFETHPVTSPEPSRAVENGLEDFNESNTLEQIEPPPTTAPSPNEHDTSRTTEFFSVDSDKCIRSRSPLANPFWLRRPESAETFSMKRAANETTHISPTRSRSALQQSDAKIIQLVAPKVPLGTRALPARRPSPNSIKSTASAPMVISPPTEQTPLESPESLRSIVQIKQTPVAAATKFVPATSQTQPSQMKAAALPQMLIPATCHEEPTAKPTPFPPLSDPKDGRQGYTSQPHSLVRPTREEDQHCAERLVHSQPHSSSSCRNTRSQRDQHAPPPRHVLIASPTPASSTGFVYKKTGGAKWTIGNAPRSKPRAVNFNSSPAMKEALAASKPSSQIIDAVVQVDVPETRPLDARLPQPEERAQHTLTCDPVDEQHSLGISHSSRQSAISTQAAMLLAQLEFQESTFPASSSRSQRPWSQSQEATPRPMIPELSPAMTPLSVFRPQLERPHPFGSVLRGPPMSTQDLFAAASPFAFSTVKKRHDATQHSNLSTVVMPLDDQGERGLDASPRSPTSPSDGTLLEDKNVAPSPWSFHFEKDDAHTSIDGNGNNGSLHFAERLLRNLDS